MTLTEVFLKFNAHQTGKTVLNFNRTFISIYFIYVINTLCASSLNQHEDNQLIPTVLTSICSLNNEESRSFIDNLMRAYKSTQDNLFNQDSRSYNIILNKNFDGSLNIRSDKGLVTNLIKIFEHDPQHFNQLMNKSLIDSDNPLTFYNYLRFCHLFISLNVNQYESGIIFWRNERYPQTRSLLLALKLPKNAQYSQDVRNLISNLQVRFKNPLSLNLYNLSLLKIDFRKLYSKASASGNMLSNIQEWEQYINSFLWAVQFDNAL